MKYKHKLHTNIYIYMYFYTYIETHIYTLDVYQNAHLSTGQSNIDMACGMHTL